MNNVQVVILAGGRGSRLQSLTDDLPKPMVSINGKPFLEILLQLLHRERLSKFLLLTGYLHDRVSDYFKDGSEFGISITYSVESKPLGTAGALKNAEKLLEDEFLLLNGDTFSEIDYHKFIRFSKSHNKICNMLCYNGSLFEDMSYNLTLKNSLVTDYSKTIASQSFNAIDAGLYFMKKDITTFINMKFSALEEEIFHTLISKRQLSGYQTKTRFYDIGTMERLNIFDSVFKLKKT